MSVLLLLFSLANVFMSVFFFFSSRRRHTRWPRDWSSDVCSSDLLLKEIYLYLMSYLKVVILLLVVHLQWIFVLTRNRKPITLIKLIMFHVIYTMIRRGNNYDKF